MKLRQLPQRVCWGCVALGLVVCLYGPLVWAQDAGHVWGPDWQMIAVGLLGIVGGGITIYWQGQRSSISGLGKADQAIREKIERNQTETNDRIFEVERQVGELRELVRGQYLMRAEFNEILKGLQEICENNLKHTLAIQRRLDLSGVPYQPPI